MSESSRSTRAPQRSAAAACCCLLAGVSLAMAGEAPECQLDEASREHLRSGQQWLVAGELDRAVEELERANETSGGACYEPLVSLAAAELERARYEEAAEAALEAGRVATSIDQEAAADLLRARVLVVRYEAETGTGVEADPELLTEAENLCRWALRHESSLAEGPHFFLARSLDLQGSHEAARSEYESYLGDHPEGAYADRAVERLKAIYASIGLPEEPLEVEGDLIPPVPVFKQPPEYPKKLRRKRIGGTVVVRAIIDREGKVSDVELVEGSHPKLDESTLEAVEQWTFEPARLRYTREPVAVYYTVTMNFQLGN